MKSCVVAKMLIVVLVCSSFLACAGNKAPILVAQSAVATANIVGELSTAGKNLTDAAVLAPSVNLHLQKTLLDINTKMQPVPEMLRTLDRLQKAGDSTVDLTERVIAVLTVIGQDLTGAVAGVPIADTTKALIDLVRSAQGVVSSVLVEVAKIKGREK